MKCSGRALAIVIAASATIAAAQSPNNAAPPAGQPQPSITVTFWNIQWFPGRRPNASAAEEKRQVREVHRDIAQFSSDVVAMEEVRDWHNAELAVQPLRGFKVDVCSNFPPREGQHEAQQVAIASRLQPISAWAELWKSGDPITPPRGFAFAAYDVAPGKVLLVYALHLKSNRGEIHENMRLREESLRQLTSHISAMTAAYGKMGQIACVVGGDFNTAPDDRRFAGEKTVPTLTNAGFSWAWQNVPAASRITLPPDQRFPPACFDHIFFRGATLVRAWVSETAPQSSDHRPVNATLSFAVSSR